MVAAAFRTPGIRFGHLFATAALGAIAGCTAWATADRDLPYLDHLPPLIDRELLYFDPEMGDAPFSPGHAAPQLSPDGAFLSFTKPLKGVMNIWVKRVDEPMAAARPITTESHRPLTRRHYWSADSRYILFVQDEDGDENYNIFAVDPSQAVDIDFRRTAARKLTDLAGVQVRIYSLPRSMPDYAIVGLNDRDPASHDVYRLRISTGERDLLHRNDHNVRSWTFDGAGTLRLVVRWTADRDTEVAVPTPDGFEPIYREDIGLNPYGIRPHPDGHRFFMGTAQGSDLGRLVLLDPRTGSMEPICEDPVGEADFGAGVYSDVTGDLLATYYTGDRQRIRFHDPQFRRDHDRIRAAIPDGELTVVSRTADENRWLYSITRDVDPGSIYLYDRARGQVDLVYRIYPNLPREHLARMEAFRYTARDGLEIPGYLTLPRGVEPSNLPLVVLPHGGPWIRDYWGYHPDVQFLANRGYAVFQPNFRGSSGYGIAFLDAGNHELGTGHMQHDITDGVRHLVADGIADPDRVAIVGGSYGGYAALAGLAFTPELYAAGVSEMGFSNLITLIESFPAWWGLSAWHVRVGDPDHPVDRKRLVEQSPLFSAHRIAAPLLLVHGANDPRVRKEESDQIVSALRDLSRPVEYLVLPDEGHEITGRENRLAVASALERFLAEHLRGRFQAKVPSDVAERLAHITVDVDTIQPR
jgi:dipeptidyl aminopeptidase/acylaminoacyl peptidase